MRVGLFIPCYSSICIWNSWGIEVTNADLGEWIDGAARVVSGAQPQASRAAGQSAFSGPTFGKFISGPSKMADIERSLVIGAHGPRSLTVCFLDG